MAKAIPLGRRKILWVKTGWAKSYAGDKVDGNFPWVAEGKVGHETYNFEPDSDGSYYCYVPPQGRGGHQPQHSDPHGWTVVCLAKKPKQKGIHIVGWYEDATLEGKYELRPEAPDTGEPQRRRTKDSWYYSIRSERAFLIPVEERMRPFSSPSVRQGKYSFLDGPGVARTQNKQQVLRLIDERIKALRRVAIANPGREDWDEETDPVRSFGSPEHRNAVEKAAEKAVIAHYKRGGYACEDMTKKNKGYDFKFTKGSEILCVEVKGTSGEAERFYLTRREYNFRMNPRWRLAIVTKARSPERKMTIYGLSAFERRFELECLSYEGTPRPLEASN